MTKLPEDIATMDVGDVRTDLSQLKVAREDILKYKADELKRLATRRRLLLNRLEELAIAEQAGK